MDLHDRKKILAVDDQPINLQLYDMLLGDLYQLEMATNGEEAIAVASRFRPDLILLDVMMPGWDGYETCRRLRSDSQHRFCKILLVSAEYRTSDRLKGYDAGADDYITKPFDDEELVAKVEVFLRLKFAEEVDKLKSEVLTLLCHETRTPLNFVIAPAEILASDASMDDARRMEWGRMVLDGTRRLHDLFEKVMLLSQFKSGKPDVPHAPCDVVGVVASAISGLEGATMDRGVRIEATLPGSAMIHANREHMVLVCRSLLDNAIRFSSEGGRVAIDVRIEDREVHVAVVDNGDGIQKDRLPHVFEEFAAHDVLHHSEGQGLSLALSHAIVAHLGGSIDVTSEPGVETTFTVHLPTLAAEGSPERASC